MKLSESEDEDGNNNFRITFQCRELQLESADMAPDKVSS